LGIFAVELGLSLFRVRMVTATVRAEGPAPAGLERPAGQPTPEAETGGSVRISPEGYVVVDAAWQYRIGPRFPTTTVRAQITDEAGTVVASDAHTFTCEGDTLNCTGNHTFSLRYGLQDGAGSAQTWPVGTYTVQVTRANTDRTSAVVVARELQVIGN
jgi:hypothetical protein